MMKKLLLSSLFLLITACGTSIESLEPKFTQVNAGDTKEQIVTTLGKPAESESSSILGISHSTLRWNDLEKNYKIDFIAGRMITKESKSR